MDELEKQRKRILFRADHRGTKEADVLIGSFAKKYIHDLSQQDLNDFEVLLDLPDLDVLEWLVGKTEVPAAHNTPLMQKILQYKLAEHQP
jgi:antitoxin CptB